MVKVRTGRCARARGGTTLESMGEFQESGWRIAVSTELHRIEDQCACAARSQTEIVRVWRIINMLLCTLAVLTAGVAGSLVLASYPTQMVPGGLAMGATLLIAMVGFVAPARREGQAAQASRQYTSLQTLARQAWQVDLSGQTFPEARLTLTSLTDRWHRVNDLALPVPKWAQRRAEDETFPDSVEDVMVSRMSDVLSIFPARA